ncbi:hypothetical protein WMY93_019093 [Mugilogobius chulae]|uniref:Uncharacterized protein n=1 Tax=Mugilogobius chulae TaxID=88201 RepID=A0AAW0NNK1_9GOBI
MSFSLMLMLTRSTVKYMMQFHTFTSRGGINRPCVQKKKIQFHRNETDSRVNAETCLCARLTPVISEQRRSTKFWAPGEKLWVEGGCDDVSSAHCPQGFSKQPLLLVSLDGWRAEYLQSWSKLVPVIDKLQKCGTSTPFMQAAFPSKTFPNHYTIVTIDWICQSCVFLSPNSGLSKCDSDIPDDVSFVFTQSVSSF